MFSKVLIPSRIIVRNLVVRSRNMFRSAIARVRGMFDTLALRVMVFMTVFLGISLPTFAQSVALDIDTDQFITSINTWLALAVGIVVIGVGIRGAFALAGYVGEMIVAAFERRRM